MHNFDPIVDGKKVTSNKLYKKDLKVIFNIAVQYSEWIKQILICKNQQNIHTLLSSKYS